MNPTPHALFREDTTTARFFMKIWSGRNPGFKAVPGCDRVEPGPAGQAVET